jgi:hypothetical protein
MPDDEAMPAAVVPAKEGTSCGDLNSPNHVEFLQENRLAAKTGPGTRGGFPRRNWIAAAVMALSSPQSEAETFRSAELLSCWQYKFAAGWLNGEIACCVRRATHSYSA